MEPSRAEQGRAEPDRAEPGRAERTSAFKMAPGQTAVQPRLKQVGFRVQGQLESDLSWSEANI